MNRDEAIAALDLCTSLGYSCTLQSGLSERMCPPQQCSIKLIKQGREEDQSHFEMDLERLWSDFADTPYKPVYTSFGNEIFLYPRTPAIPRVMRPRRLA